MTYGMTQKEYWEEDPYLAVAYREANRLKTEAENEKAWWQGVYIRDAVYSAITQTMFWIKKPYNYPSIPIRVTPYTEDEKKELASKERQKFIDSMTAYKNAWDRQHG